MKKGSLKMKKTIVLTSVIAITAVSVATIIKKMISHKFHSHDDVEIIVEENDVNDTNYTDFNDDVIVIKIEPDDDENMLLVITDLMNDEDCSSFKYAILETVLSQIENNDLEAARETMELMGI